MPTYPTHRQAGWGFTVYASYIYLFRKDSHGPGGAIAQSKGGYQHILVIIDYATRYPEAIPLRSTKATTLEAELVKVFS